MVKFSDHPATTEQSSFDLPKDDSLSSINNNPSLSELVQGPKGAYFKKLFDLLVEIQALAISLKNTYADTLVNHEVEFVLQAIADFEDLRTKDLFQKDQDLAEKLYLNECAKMADLFDCLKENKKSSDVIYKLDNLLFNYVITAPKPKTGISKFSIFKVAQSTQPAEIQKEIEDCLQYKRSNSPA